MIRYNSSFYLYGGYYKNDFPLIDDPSALYKYDLKDMSWTVVPQQVLISTVTDFAMVVYDDTLFRFQGYNPNLGNLKDIYKINLKATSLDWQRVDYQMDLNDLPNDSYSYTVSGSKVIFSFGWNKSRLRNDVMMVDLCKVYAAQPEPLQFTDLTLSYTAPSDRKNHQLVSIGTKLYTFGGSGLNSM